MSTDAATTDLTALHIEAFAFIAKALRIPEPAINEDDELAHERLTRRRTDAVWSLANSLSIQTDPGVVRERIDRFAARIGQLPVLYRPFDPELAKEARR